MTGLLLAGPVLLPLLAAALGLLLSPFPSAQRLVTVGTLAALSVDAAVLLHRSSTGGPVSVQAGGHPAPLGITLVADRLSALMLLVGSAVLLLVAVYAIGQGAAERRPENVPSVFHPSYLVLAAGVGLVFLTGDLFTLFVGLEMMLMASYALVSLGSTEERVRAGSTYVVSSLLASILLVTSIGLVYAVTGTVNLADLADRTPQLPSGLRALLGLMLLLALGIKAAVVPLHWWLPDSYPNAPAPVTAAFAALLTKVGVYAILRTQSLLFPREEPWTLLLVLAAATMIVGVLGALAQDDLSRLLSFGLVAHIGFILFGVALTSEAGVAAAVLFLVHSLVVQATLFLVLGLVQRARGTTHLGELGGLAATSPWLAPLFLVPALSLSGIPPLAGFVGKLALLQAAVAQGGVLPLSVAAVALLTSLLTLAAMGRVWAVAFWREPVAPAAGHTAADDLELGTTAPAWAMRGAAVAGVVAGLGLAAAAGPLSALATSIAAEVRDPLAYREAVLGAEAGG